MGIAFIANILIWVAMEYTEVYEILENCQKLVNLVYEREFLLSLNPVHYEWYKLPEDSCVCVGDCMTTRRSLLFSSLCVIHWISPIFVE